MGSEGGTAGTGAPVSLAVEDDTQMKRASAGEATAKARALPFSCPNPWCCR